MATITPKTDKQGNVTAYKVRVCLGRNEQYKQIWKTTTIKRPQGLTPAKERKEVERLAEAWENEQRTKFSQTHTTVDKDKITLAAFVRDHWWPDHVLDGSHTPSSIEFYRQMSRDIVSYFGEKKKLSQIDTEAVKRFITHFNSAKTNRGEPYSPTTIQHLFGTLRNILRYAWRMEYIPKEPTQKLLPKEKPHRAKKTVDFLTADQARDFLRCLDTEPLLWRAYVNVLVTCGLRRGEACALQWRDIDPAKLTLRIERNITIDKTQPEKYLIGKTKTGEGRTVPISRRVYGLLMQLKREQEETFHATIMPGCFIFCRPEGPSVPLYPSTPTRWMAQFVKRHHLPNMSPHDLRHTAATLALESGANLKDVQQLLGHADPSTTMAFYTGVTEEAQRRTVEGIESMIG